MCYPLKNYITFTKFSSSHQQFLAAITRVMEPRFYHEAVKDERWRKAMVDEISALKKMDCGYLRVFP